MVQPQSSDALLDPGLDNTNWQQLWRLGYQAINELETEAGILASARNELFGCIFGRDSLITSLLLLKVYQTTHDVQFLNIVRKVLITMSKLQGQNLNIESGEEPGKIIHEYRPDKHEHLTRPNPLNGHEKAWYLYPDQAMRNYDTVDATPLFLITAYRYHQIAHQHNLLDRDFLEAVIPSVQAAIHWIFWYADSNGDGLIDYQLNPKRTFGGLHNHNWMDSTEATFHEDEQPVPHPIAPVEAQAYAYAGLRMWAIYFANQHPTGQSSISSMLNRRADQLKADFYHHFVIPGSLFSLASAVDGQGRQIRNQRSSIGHCLWASLNKAEDDLVDGIVNVDDAEQIVKRLLSPDMFEPQAGIRTLSTKSSHFEANSYHNGSIWPHDNSLIAQGFENYGFTDEADLVRIAMLKAISHFQHAVELYVYDHDYNTYQASHGQTANKTQAWAAAAILSAVAKNSK